MNVATCLHDAPAWREVLAGLLQHLVKNGRAHYWIAVLIEATQVEQIIGQVDRNPRGAHDGLSGRERCIPFISQGS